MNIKWEGYDEATWEAFIGFVKDTAPMVERYLIKKSLMKPLQIFNDLKRVKSFDMDSCDPNTAALIKELKALSTGNEQLIVL